MDHGSRHKEARMQKAWKATMYWVIETPSDEMEADMLADEIERQLTEHVPELGGAVVYVTKVRDLDTISEEEFDAA
jgi:hypothetical protein